VEQPDEVRVTAGIALAVQPSRMNLADMLDRCHDLETRAAALYRSFAAGARDPDLRTLWTAMAREEKDHARILDAERTHLPTVEAWVTDLSNWDGVVSRIEAKLLEAERLASGAGADQQLAAALELEMTEIEPVRQMLVAASEHRPRRPIAQNHALRLADAAERFSTDPHVRQQAALLRARARAW
jgi:rubrerythrin